MSEAPTAPKTTAKKGEKVVWRDADDATLVSVLRTCKDDGMQADSGWKPQAWTLVANALTDSPGAVKTPEKCRDHFGTLKSQWIDVRELAQKSGFGFDPGLKIVTATDEVWEKLLEVPGSKKYARWRKKPFALYDDMQYLVDGIVATGVSAFHPGAGAVQANAAASPEDDQDDEDDNQSVRAGAAPPKTPVRRRFHDDITPSSPPPTTGKRSASSSPQKSAPRRRRRRNADAAHDMAGAVRDLVGLMEVMNTPKVRAAAVQLMEEDDELSDEEAVAAMNLFEKEIAVAQTYIGSKSKARRTAYLQTKLAAAF